MVSHKAHHITEEDGPPPAGPDTWGATPLQQRTAGPARGGASAPPPAAPEPAPERAMPDAALVEHSPSKMLAQPPTAAPAASPPKGSPAPAPPAAAAPPPTRSPPAGRPASAGGPRRTATQAAGGGLQEVRARQELEDAILRIEAHFKVRRACAPSCWWPPLHSLKSFVIKGGASKGTPKWLEWPPPRLAHCARRWSRRRGGRQRTRCRLPSGDPARPLPRLPRPRRFQLRTPKM